MTNSTNPRWSAPARGRCGNVWMARFHAETRRLCVKPFLITSRRVHTLPLADVLVSLGAVAAGAERHQSVVRPGTRHDRQEDNGIENQPDEGMAEDGEERQERDGQQTGDRSQNPGHATIASQLFLDRFDAQAQPAQLAPPDVLPGTPARVEILGRVRRQ
jgi:hypothetical protein